MRYVRRAANSCDAKPRMLPHQHLDLMLDIASVTPIARTAGRVGEVGVVGQAPAFTSIFFCCSIAFADFGIVMVSTPLEKSAAILSRSTPSGT